LIQIVRIEPFTNFAGAASMYKRLRFSLGCFQWLLSLVHRLAIREDWMPFWHSGAPSVKVTLLQILKLKPGFETLGVLVDFLASEPPYATFRAGDLVRRDDRAKADRLSRRLELMAPPAGNAAALTIVKVRQQAHLLPMIRACREQNRGIRVFFYAAQRKCFLKTRVLLPNVVY
jgi:hypothetical protein